MPSSPNWRLLNDFSNSLIIREESEKLKAGEGFEFSREELGVKLEILIFLFKFLAENEQESITLFIAKFLIVKTLKSC